MRPIDADALIEKLDIDKTNIMRYLSILKSTNLNDGYDIFVSTIQIGEVDRFRDVIEEAPTVERPRGKWIMHDDEILGLSCECSACHIETCGNSPFCPNCGADMRGEGE